MPLTLRTTLCETRDGLRALRRVVAARGHIDAMLELDTLIGCAQNEAAKSIVAIDAAAKRSPPSPEPAKPSS